MNSTLVDVKRLSRYTKRLHKNTNTILYINKRIGVFTNQVFLKINDNILVQNIFIYTFRQ